MRFTLCFPAFTLTIIGAGFTGLSAAKSEILIESIPAYRSTPYFDKIEVFGVPGVKEIEKNEFQAVYRENLIRQELNMPLRTHYITNETTDGTFIKGLGPNMLDSSGKPKRPSWY